MTVQQVPLMEDRQSRLQVAKKDAPVAQTNRGISHSTTAKQLEQHL